MWRLLTFDKNNGEKYTTEHPEKDLMGLLVAKTESLGHMLTFNEATADPDMVTPNSYAYYFGSFSEAAKQAWQKVRAMSYGGVLTENAYKLINSNCNKPSEKGVKQMSEITKTKRGGKKPQYTIAELQAQLRVFYAKNGRLPTQNDVRKYDSGLPAWATLIKFLGPKSGWMSIVEEYTTTSESPTTDMSSTISEPQTIAKVEPIEESDDQAEETSYDDDTINEVIDEVYGNDDLDDDIEDGPMVESVSRVDHSDSIGIEIKITLPGREKPVLVNLTI